MEVGISAILLLEAQSDRVAKAQRVFLDEEDKYSLSNKKALKKYQISSRLTAQS